MRDPDKFLSPEHFWFGDLNVYNDIHHERIRVHRKHDNNDIDNERIRVHRKHDDYGGSMERKEFTDSAWLSVLVEEVGEVARELCDYRHSIDRSGFKRRLRDELIQVAAMATAWVDAIDSDQPEPATGAVAGEPESTPAAERYVATREPQCGDPYHRHTGSCFLYDTQRHPRAADTQEAHDAG